DRPGPVRARPLERRAQQPTSGAATAAHRSEVHALQLQCRVAEIAERDRADDLVTAHGDPRGGVVPARIGEVLVELGIGREAELSERVRAETPEGVRLL